MKKDIVVILSALLLCACSSNQHYTSMALDESRTQSGGSLDWEQLRAQLEKKKQRHNGIVKYYYRKGQLLPDIDDQQLVEMLKAKNSRELFAEIGPVNSEQTLKNIIIVSERSSSLKTAINIPDVSLEILFKPENEPETLVFRVGDSDE